MSVRSEAHAWHPAERRGDRSDHLRPARNRPPFLGGRAGRWLGTGGWHPGRPLALASLLAGTGPAGTEPAGTEPAGTVTIATRRRLANGWRPDSAGASPGGPLSRHDD